MGWSNNSTFQVVIVTGGGGGLFVYSGAPKVGNLVFSVVAPGVTHDPLGNPVTAVLEAGTIGSNFTQIDQSGDIILWSGGNQVIAMNPAKQAVFIYSPAAGAGNLTASIAVAAGTDSFGNHYLQDFGAYNNLLGMASMLNGGGLTFFSGNLAAGWSSVSTVNFDTGTQATKIGSTGLEVIGGLITDTATVNGQETVNNQAGNVSALTVNQGPTSTNSAAQILIALTAGFTAQQLWLAGRVAGDTNNRISLDVNTAGSPRIRFGPGGSAPDCTIQRDDTITHRLDVNGADWDINTVGRGLMIAEGTNARMGTGVLSAGAAIVSNTTVTASTRIFLTTQVASGTPGALRVGTVTPGSGFGVNSTNGADNSTFAYLLIEPG